MAIYGCHYLSAGCAQFGIPSRVVTWESRLNSPLPEYRDPPRGFRFSYALTPGHHTENERVPLEELQWISTEERTYSADEALELLADDAEVRGPKTLLPGRETGTDG